MTIATLTRSADLKRSAQSGSRSLQRARGAVRLSARISAGRTRIGALYQSGSAKALLPRSSDTGLTAVLLNTAGGLTGGDHFSLDARAEAGSTLTLTTQTAERLYRAQSATSATVTTGLSAGEGATLHWLPQETIAFDHSALSRTLSVDLAPDATFLGVEPLVLGRAAMGESVTSLALIDRWRVRRDGRLIYADGLRINGDAQAITRTPATLNGALASASIVYSAQDAGQHLAGLRACISETGAASLIAPGVLAARLSAPTGFALRRALVPALELLRGAPLPTVWKM